MSYLERIAARATESAGDEPAKGVEGGFDPFAGDLRALIPELPVACASGLRRLKSMQAPRLLHPGRWPLVVSDALSLAREGWAAKGLALGWSPLDLFGAMPSLADDPAGDGLAVWLGGRQLVALCDTYAVVGNDGGGRSYFNRREAPGAVLLWDLGKAQC